MAAKDVDEVLARIERRIQETLSYIAVTPIPGTHPMERKGAIEALKYVLKIIEEERGGGE
ncbi:hypothetical protein E3E36_10785 [Thermococcus sp. M36]|uniref:hypothetical protein n=1 Tax=unclassified Thermococcus TaxID=2627626 RepID=UPI00143A7728|nr:MULTISPECIES: hypothetical protein [unclassified Thermococcus]NJE06611.1 hypothetical protein [Thermococcus sp. M36]NJE55649.1 hypothetical protein [Thermococcus sp. 21S9]